MLSLNKLSIEYLADAFTSSETQNGRVFVAFGRAETLATVRAFLKAMKREPETLWGAAFVESDRAPHGALILGSRPFGRETLVTDFTAALDTLLESDQKPPTDVWGRILRL